MAHLSVMIPENNLSAGDSFDEVLEKKFLWRVLGIVLFVVLFLAVILPWIKNPLNR